MKTISTKNKIIAVAVGASVNLLLFFIKLYVGLSTNSIAIYADALNSITDGGVCLIAAVGFALAGTKPDKKYPFGLGKSEELLDFIISVIILITGGIFAYVSLERIFYPIPVWYSELYAVIVAATAAVKLLLALFFRFLTKKSDTKVLKGLSADSTLDFFITLCTLVSFTLSAKNNFSVDGFAGIIISILLMIEGIKMTVSAAGTILGKNNPDECKEIKSLIESDTDIESVKEINYVTFGETKIYTAEITVKNGTSHIDELSERLENAVERENIKLYLKIRRYTK